MALFINEESNKIISNPQLYNNILLDNRKESIRIILNDIEINHKLIIERLYINDNECYVNTKRGNFILNTEDPKLHLVYYNKRWLSIGRENALPLIDVLVDRRTIYNNQFENCLFGQEFIQTKSYTTNNGVDGRYYISDRLLVAAKNYHLGNLGCIFVYTKDHTNQYTIIEDMITVPYDYRQGLFQGQFASKFGLINMNGYDYLIVCAPNKKTNSSTCSVYIFSYKKRSDHTFYFKNETFGREIVVPRTSILRTFVITPNKAFHLIYEQEIITYYLSTYDTNTIRVSEPFSVRTPEIIRDAKSTNDIVYVLTQNNVIMYSFQTVNGPLINVTNYIANINSYNIKSLDIDVSEQIIGISDMNIYFFNDLTSTTIFGGLNYPIHSIDLLNKSQNQLLILTTNGDIHTLENKTNFQTKGSISMTSMTSKLKYDITDSSSAIVGIPDIWNGMIKRIHLDTFSEFVTDNFVNKSSIQPQVIVSTDAENVYIYDRRTKIISVLLRNAKNDFVLSHTIHPDESTSEYLRFRDTILDVKINHGRDQLLFGTCPYNDNKSSVLICNLETYSYLGKLSDGTTNGYGTSIDIKQDTAVISDPNVMDVMVSGVKYEKGTIDIYNLKPESNFAKINLNSLRSTSRIGKIVKLSPNINEVLSIGTNDNGISSLSIFSNIYDTQYRRLTIQDNISDVDFFMEGKLILTNKDTANKFHQYQKVNGCFEIITKRDTIIPSLTDKNSITILPMGKNYTFFNYQNGLMLFDIRNMKLIQNWSDVYTSNVSVAIDGSTISYANQNENNIEYIVCS